MDGVRVVQRLDGDSTETLGAGLVTVPSNAYVFGRAAPAAAHPPAARSASATAQRPPRSPRPCGAVIAFRRARARITVPRCRRTGARERRPGVDSGQHHLRARAPGRLPSRTTPQVLPVTPVTSGHRSVKAVALSLMNPPPHRRGVHAVAAFIRPQTARAWASGPAPPCSGTVAVGHHVLPARGERK